MFCRTLLNATSPNECLSYDYIVTEITNVYYYTRLPNIAYKWQNGAQMEES